MEVYLIRHTEPNISKDICYGQSDISLKDNFQKQAQKIQKYLPSNLSSFYFYSSPLKRCLLLGDYLTKTKINQDARLMELHFGDWELKKWDDINAKQLQFWMDNYVQETCPNGESYLQLYHRSTAFLKFLVQTKNPYNIVIAHGGSIRSILSYITNTPLNQSFKIKIGYGNVVHFSLKKNKYRLNFLKG